MPCNRILGNFPQRVAAYRKLCYLNNFRLSRIARRPNSYSVSNTGNLGINPKAQGFHIQGGDSNHSPSSGFLKNTLRHTLLLISNRSWEDQHHWE